MKTMVLDHFAKRPENKSFKVRERFNTKNLKLISKLEDFSFLDDDDDDKVDSIPATLNKILKDLKKKKTDCLKRTFVQRNGIGRYYYPKDKDNNYGALYLKNPIRGFIAPEGTLDLDIKNCHPTLLAQLIKENDVVCKGLDAYVHDREGTMKKYEFDKEALLVMINDKNFKSDNEFLNSIHKTIYTTFIPIMKEKYKDFYKQCVALDKHKVKEEGKEPNVEGTFNSRILQEAEQDVMYYCMEFLKNKNIDYGCLIYDGIHVYDRLEPDTISALSDYIAKKCEYKVTFSIKPFPKQDQIWAELKRLGITEEEEEEAIEYTESQIAQYILDQHKGCVINNKGTLFAYHKYFWKEDVKQVFKYWLSKCDLQTRIGRRVVSIRNLNKNWCHYIEHMMCLCEDLPVVDILNKEKDILSFLNGYYDFKTASFVEYKPDTIMYSTFMVNRKFPKAVDGSINKELKKKVLEIFDDNEERAAGFFMFVVRALSGHVEDKESMCLLGERNSAKGSIVKLIMAAFKGVIGTINNGCFENKPSFESAERQNSFMSVFCNYLMVIGEEIKKDMEISSEKNKSAVSGGDVVQYRTAFGKTTVDNVKALYLMTSNHVPKFSTNDSYETFLICEAPCKFVDEISGNNSLGYKERLKDPEVGMKFKNEEYLDAFTHFVLSYYTPEKPNYDDFREQTREIAETEDNYQNPENILEESILKHFIITKNPEHRIKKSDVHKKSKYTGSTPQKFKKYLTSKGVGIKLRDGIEYYCGLVEVNTESSLDQ